MSGERKIQNEVHEENQYQVTDDISIEEKIAKEEEEVAAYLEEIEKLKKQARTFREKAASAKKESKKQEFEQRAQQIDDDVNGYEKNMKRVEAKLEDLYNTLQQSQPENVKKDIVNDQKQQAMNNSNIEEEIAVKKQEIADSLAEIEKLKKQAETSREKATSAKTKKKKQELEQEAQQFDAEIKEYEEYINEVEANIEKLHNMLQQSQPENVEKEIVNDEEEIAVKKQEDEPSVHGIPPSEDRIVENNIVGNSNEIVEEILKNSCKETYLNERYKIIKFNVVQLRDIRQTSASGRILFEYLTEVMNELYHEKNNNNERPYSIDSPKLVVGRQTTRILYFYILIDDADNLLCQSIENIIANLVRLSIVMFLETHVAWRFDANTQHIYLNNFYINTRYIPRNEDHRIIGFIRYIVDDERQQSDTSFMHQIELNISNELFINRSFMKQLIELDFLLNEINNIPIDIINNERRCEIQLTRNIVQRNFLLNKNIVSKQYTKFYNQYEWFIELEVGKIGDTDIRDVDIITIQEGSTYEFCQNVFHKWINILKHFSIDPLLVDRLLLHSLIRVSDNENKKYGLAFQVFTQNISQLFEYIGIFLHSLEPTNRSSSIDCIYYAFFCVYNKTNFSDHRMNWFIVQRQEEIKPSTEVKSNKCNKIQTFVKNIYKNSRLQRYHPIIILPIPHTTRIEDYIFYTNILNDSTQHYFTNVCISDGYKELGIFSGTRTFLYYYNNGNYSHYDRIPPQIECDYIQNRDDTNQIIQRYLIKSATRYHQCFFSFTIDYKELLKTKDYLTSTDAEVGITFDVIKNKKDNTFYGLFNRSVTRGERDRVHVPKASVRLHTHPLHCYLDHIVFIMPPSGPDMREIFRYNMNDYCINFVASVEGVYSVQINSSIINLFRSFITEKSFYHSSVNNNLITSCFATLLYYIFGKKEDYRKIGSIVQAPLFDVKDPVVRELASRIRGFTEVVRMCPAVPIQITHKAARLWVSTTNQLTLQKCVEEFRLFHERGTQQMYETDLGHELHGSLIIQTLETHLQGKGDILYEVDRIFETTFKSWSELEYDRNGFYSFDHIKYAEAREINGRLVCPPAYNFEV